MTTVFLSGSRKLGRLSSEVRRRLDNMVENQLTIITGDANGADKAMQAYLADKGYRNVMIFYVGEKPRNNVGDWPTRNIIAEQPLSGRDFYARKDREMSKLAECGFVLWDGKSAGSVQNMLWLIEGGKKLVVYFAPERRFYNFATEVELIEFLLGMDKSILKDISRKIQLPNSLQSAARRQMCLAL